MVSASIKEKCYSASENRQGNYHGIDIIKFLCAIMVFTIHISPFQGEISRLSEYLNFGLQHGLCRLAVPFYFVSSGFFLFKKMSPDALDTEAIKRYCFKILRLLGTWYMLLFVGAVTHLWYLGATVIAVTLLSLCFRYRVRFRVIALLACLLYTVGLLGNSYYGLIAPLTRFPLFNSLVNGYDSLFSTTRNGIFMGFIFVFLGAAFACCRIELKTQTALIGLMASLLCLLAELFLLKYNDIPIKYDMYVSLLPATFFLFAFAKAVPLKDSAVYKRLRNIGLLVYFVHREVNWFVSSAIGSVEKHWGIAAAQYQFAASLLCTLLLAIGVERLSRKEKYRWLNWLLS